MIIDWLNGGLVFRSENEIERKSLAALLEGIRNPHTLEDSYSVIHTHFSEEKSLRLHL
jgi:hypothetical protein